MYTKGRQSDLNSKVIRLSEELLDLNIISKQHIRINS